MRLDEIKGFLLDMDGTFYLGDHLLPGALELLDLFNQRGIPFMFLTNNSSKSKEEYHEKLVRLGVGTENARVFTSGDATVRYILENTSAKEVFLVGTPGLERTFKANGIVLVEEDPELLVLGFDTTLTYDKLRKLCDYVREGVTYIATHSDINCPTPKGFIPDIGSMIAMIKASTEREPDLVIGKPNRIIVDMIAAELGVMAEVCAMVGDRLYTDIALGQTAGVTTVLVLSGETSREDLETSIFKPDYVFNDLQGLGERLRKG
ncbi:MAG: HAD-IIA family hydrolase [Chloroflexota bacterium]